MEDWERTTDEALARAEGTCGVTYQKNGKDRYVSVPKCRSTPPHVTGGSVYEYQRLPNSILKADIDAAMKADLFGCSHPVQVGGVPKIVPVEDG